MTPNHDKAKIYQSENAKTSQNQKYKKANIKNDKYYLDSKEVKEVKESSYDEKYSEITNISTDTDTTFTIKVKLDYDDIITFVTSQYVSVSDPKNYTYPEDYTIKELKKNQNIKLSPLEPNGLLHYDINLLKGKGTIKTFINNEEYLLESGFKDNLNLLFNSEPEQSSDIYINITANEDFLFYYRIIKNTNNNLAELNFQKVNYFKYLNITDDSFWPLYYYMKINITKNEQSIDYKDINFNYKFSKSYTIDSFDPSKENYNATFSLVNKNYIAEMKYKNNINLDNFEIEYSSEYREDITAGYSLINARSIKEQIKENENYYLLVIINYTHSDSNEDINVALTAFDYNKDYILPMNEYFLLLINQERNISIPKTYENNEYNPFIEYSLHGVTLKPNPHIDEIYPKYGKIFYKLNQKQNYTLTLKEDTFCKTSNLLIKYGLSKYSDFSYFKIVDDKIKYDEINKTMSFDRIMVNEKNQYLYNNNDKLYDIYTIKIYKVIDANSFVPETIYENAAFYHSNKNIDNSDNKTISYNISFIDYGYYYLSVLAEGRKGNVYEYLLYESLFITNISDLTEAKITISYEDYNNSYIPEYTRQVKFIADLVSEAEEQDFIKLSLKHKNHNDTNLLYVSTNEQLYNSEKLYQDSEYKVITRNTSLIIPVSEVKNKSLYIRIPCNELCDYTFYFQIYRMNDVVINDNECFDININNKRVIFKYNIDNINNTKSSLFTMTSYTINDLSSFNVLTNGANLERSYFNGYSYIYNRDEYLSKEEDILSFTIDYKYRINVCHRFLNNNNTIYDTNETNIDSQKIIFDGDIKYTTIESGKMDCFLIYKNYENNLNITEYKINFITKTKNIQIDLYSKNENEKGPTFLLNEESYSYNFSSNYDEFCFTLIDDKSNKVENGSVLFQLLSINENNFINQTLYMPLIKGISTKQNLKKGQILYYRINENSQKSKLINVNFQTISGNPKVYHTYANNFPDYYIYDIKGLGIDEITGFRNNIKYSINIEEEEEDIYQKSTFPVIVVYCPNEKGNDDCNYYIEMSNDLEIILLNKNRKIYSYIDNNDTNNKDQYKIDLSLYDIDDSSTIYIQLYSFTGEPNLDIAEYSDNYKDNYYTYNDNGMIFNISLKERTSPEFNLIITEKNHKNAHYSLFYYITNDNKNELYLPSGEVHYNIIPKKDIEYNYYFQDTLNKTETSYIVSIYSINCDLNVNNNDKIRKFQKEINSHETIKIKLDENIRCEYTISATESNKNNEPNPLIVNDRTYQYYQFSNTFNSLNLYYLISKDDFNENKNVYVYISKKTAKQLKINYGKNHIPTIIYNYNEMVELKDLNKTDFIEYFNLYVLKITIEPNEEINNCELKIKINGNKNKYSSSLDPEEIESDIIVKGKQNNYYYRYYFKTGEDHIIGQIYLDSKGKAQLVENRDSNLISTDKTNFINIENDPNCQDGCEIKFTVLISDDEDNNEYNIYNIYLVSDFRQLNVNQNINIYGKQYFNMNAQFITEIDMSQNVDEVLFNLICLKCTVNIKTSNNEYNNIKKSIIIKLVGSSGKITYEIKSQFPKQKDDNDYYFSIINTKSPKFIYQKEATICKDKCKFILPIYSYFSFTQNKILFYVPETEQVVIYARIKNMEDYKFENFELQDDNEKKDSTTLPITNRLYINEDDYKNRNVYVEIEVKSIIDNPFTFIVSEFNELLKGDDNNLLYPKNLFIINQNTSNYTNFDHNYKIRINLVNGSGYFSLNNDKNDFYNLNYQSQEIISLPNKNKDIYKLTLYNSFPEDFIAYLDFEDNNNNNIYDLILQKTNYIKYFNTDNEKFTISLNIENIVNKNNIEAKDLFINYHFSILEGKNNSEFINSNEEIFLPTIKGIIGKESEPIESNRKSVIIQYYNDTRRGYIYIDSSVIKSKNYDRFTIIIEGKNNYMHKKVYLEVTPLYMDSKGNEPTEFPRNTYIQYKNKNQNISFSKPGEDYDILKLEYAYNDSLPLNLSLDNNIENISLGKYTVIIKNDSLKYYKKIEKEIDQLLLKYTVKKENQIEFSLNENTIEATLIDEKQNIYNITYENIKINENIINYNVSYLIRLYNYLDYLEDSEINNINTNTTLKQAYRKQLNDSEKKSNKTTYLLEFGKLDYGDYSISVLGEIYYNDNVEYFSYNLYTFNIIKVKETNFDYTWFAPLSFVIVVFIILVACIIKHCIRIKKEKKKDPSEGTLLINKISI